VIRHETTILKSEHFFLLFLASLVLSLLRRWAASVWRLERATFSGKDPYTALLSTAFVPYSANFVFKVSGGNRVLIKRLIVS
jgi:hypothetical protein